MELEQVRSGPGDAGWAPRACTLPTAERPLREAEFDALFGEAVTEVRRAGPGRVELVLRSEPDVAARAAGLAVRETGCCSFFTFALTAAGGALTLEVSVAGPHVEVLDALAARAAELAGQGSRA
ncbi:hypothetical protein [Actinomadura sp. 3N407]|uniref:hypothetical protein n=1 Tax=Actinomadura sp. 3N407 TaxID=3457423 RepID=UPI003FCD82DF